MNTAAAAAWTPDAQSAHVAATIQEFKALIRQLTKSYHKEQYMYAVAHMRCTEARRHPAYCAATDSNTLEWWRSNVTQCGIRMQGLVEFMGFLECEWKNRALAEEERVARAMERIERARGKREREGEAGERAEEAGERPGKRRAGHGGAMIAGVEVEGAD